MCENRALCKSLLSDSTEIQENQFFFLFVEKENGKQERKHKKEEEEKKIRKETLRNTKANDVTRLNIN